MLLRIIGVDFNVTHQLLIIYSACRCTNKQTCCPENNLLFPIEMFIDRKETVT
jgi:hypothetical protein